MLYLHSILNSVWMIEANYAGNYLPLISNFILGKPVDGILSASKNNIENNSTKKSGGSISIVPIKGVITKYDQLCGPTGMETTASYLTELYENQDIKGIILKIDSGGGEAYACRLIQEAISKRNKPVCAFVNDFACSAAYGIAAACDTITLNSAQAQVGSIGTMVTISDYTEYFEKQGIKLIEIYASKSKDKNNDYIEAIKGNLEPLRKICDFFNENFISSIAGFRKGRISENQDKWNSGKVFFAKEAIELGLADEIGTLEDVINYFNT